MTTAETRVQAGVTWLDMTIPDWRGRINIERLNMSNPQACVLGQVFQEEASADCFNGFDYALDAYFLADHRALSYGFEVDCDGQLMKPRYDELTRLWKAQL